MKKPEVARSGAEELKVQTISAGSPAKKITGDIHNVGQQVLILQQVLQDSKQRTGCFFGAGCPLGVYDEKEERSICLIPAVVELTKRVAAKLESHAKEGEKLKAQWNTLFNECKREGERDPTVEDVLTELRTLTSRRGSTRVLDMTREELSHLDEAICSEIAGEMHKTLPNYRNSYDRFVAWVGGMQRPYPIEIFTPNYDLLFEQALEQNSHPHFDGFVGSREPWFDLASIEHDSIPARWTRLWKLHGSINWEREDIEKDGKTKTKIVRVTREAAAKKVMIYPSHLKYDQSRRMPYLAMLDRLRAFFLHKDSPRLVVCGYSFLDEHINEVLLDGLRGNKNAQCFALMHSELEDCDRVITIAERQSNLTVLARDGAVVGNRVGLYKGGSDSIIETAPWLFQAPGSESASDTRNICNLGNFHYFGLFLERLCGGASHD